MKKKSLGSENPQIGSIKKHRSKDLEASNQTLTILFILPSSDMGVL